MYVCRPSWAFITYLKFVKLLQVIGGVGIDEDITLSEISKCLPVIEHLSSYRWTFQVICSTLLLIKTWENIVVVDLCFGYASSVLSKSVYGESYQLHWYT